MSVIAANAGGECRPDGSPFAAVQKRRACTGLYAAVCRPPPPSVRMRRIRFGAPVRHCRHAVRRRPVRRTRRLYRPVRRRMPRRIRTPADMTADGSARLYAVQVRHTADMTARTAAAMQADMTYRRRIMQADMIRAGRRTVRRVWRRIWRRILCLYRYRHGERERAAVR